MELYFPSIAVMALAFIIILVVFPRLTPYLLIVLALVLLVFAAYNHFALFGREYAAASWLEASKSFAPLLLIGLVVVMSVAYLLYLVGLRRGSNAGPLFRMPSPNASPAPNTATNMVTEAIGKALNAGNNNNANRRPLLSKDRSLNVTTREARNVAESRLAQQI